jgi:TRAP transporter TAXI family solute receptor
MQIVKIISLASALLIGGSLAGCDNKSTTSQQADKTAFITIGSGSTTAVYYPIANGIAKMINDAKINVKANARSTGGSIYNIKALQEGQLQMAIVQTDLGSYAHYGKIIPAFKTNPANKIEAIATLYPEVVHIVARKNRNINSVADLKGKRVYVGDIGSGVEQTAIQVLGAYGLTFKDIVPIRGSANLGAQQLQDNRAAAMFYTLGLGSAAIQQVAQVAPVKFLSIDHQRIPFLC